MQVFMDTIKQEKNLVLAFFLFSAVFFAVVIFSYPGDEAAAEQILGFENMGDWEAVFGMVYGTGGEYRFWLAMLVFSYVGIMFTAIPALTGSNVFSKENDENTLDILMANPISRRKILLEKTSCVLMMSFLSIVYIFVVIYSFSLIIGQNLSLALLIASCVQLFSFLIFISLLSIFISVLSLDSNRAKRYIGFIVVSSFLISMIVMFTEELEFMKYFQVFYYNESAATILKPSFDKIVWDKPIYLIIFSILLLIAIFIINDRRDLVPHYSHEIEEKRSKEKGIPFLFFYVAKLQNRFPSFVEEIQSDKLVFYLFAILMTMSGLITPPMYPGDGPWIGASKTYSGMDILVGAILRDHGVALSFIGYIATEGFGEFFLYTGIVSTILATKIVIRDQKSNTLDLVFSQPVTNARIFKERLMAITLEIFTLFLLNYIGYIVGIGLSGFGLDEIPFIGVAIFLTFLIVITMTYLIAMISVFIKNPGYAVAIGAGFFFGTLLIFMIFYTIDQLRFLSTWMPFYWIDRIRILYEKNFILEDLYNVLLYLLIILISYIVSVKGIVKREYM